MEESSSSWPSKSGCCCAVVASADNGDREAQHNSFGGCRGHKDLSDLLCVKCSLISQKFTSGFVEFTLHSHWWSHQPERQRALSTHTRQCKPDRLAIFHTATVTGSQNTWVIYSLLAAQSQAGCFPNSMKTLISPYRAQSKIGKILLEQWYGTPDTSKGLKAISRNHLLKILLLLQSWHSNFTFSHCLHIISYHHSVQQFAPSMWFKSQPHFSKESNNVLISHLAKHKNSEVIKCIFQESLSGSAGWQLLHKEVILTVYVAI